MIHFITRLPLIITTIALSVLYCTVIYYNRTNLDIIPCMEKCDCNLDQECNTDETCVPSPDCCLRLGVCTPSIPNCGPNLTCDLETEKCCTGKTTFIFTCISKDLDCCANGGFCSTPDKVCCSGLGRCCNDSRQCCGVTGFLECCNLETEFCNETAVGQYPFCQLKDNSSSVTETLTSSSSTETQTLTSDSETETDTSTECETNQDCQDDNETCLNGQCTYCDFLICPNDGRCCPSCTRTGLCCLGDVCIDGQCCPTRCVNGICPLFIK